MKKFEDYLGHRYDIISSMAETLVQAQEALAAGDMTRSEFDEISADLLEFVELDKLSDDVDIKRAIKEAIDILKTIAEHIPFT